LAFAPPDPRRAIALKVFSVLSFTAMSALIKHASSYVPPGEAVFFRSFFALIPIGLLLWHRHQLDTAFATRNVVGHGLRGLSGALGMACGFAALALLPLPEAIALGYAMPIFATALAALVLGEVVRFYRWTAIVIGLVGILVILWPRLTALRSGFEDAGQAIGALFSLAASILGGLSVIQTRRLVETENTATIVVYFSLICAAFGLLSLPFGWTMPSPTVAALLILAGICGGIGQLLLTESYRFADTSLIAPFEYTSMLFGLVLGYVVFGELPTLEMLAGAGIVIGAGLFIIWREHRLGLERARARKALTPQG
jgi:drug/metabolite transporter (DMT)-like permease